MKKILIIEDNLEIAELERDFLEAEQMETVIVRDGREGLMHALTEKWDLILLDVMLPGMDGFAICREIRAHQETPILMVSAKREDVDKIRGLGLGADDYITKPFSPPELVARVKARIERFARVSGQQAMTDEKMVFGDLVIQPGARQVFVDGEEKTLTHKEFELLLSLARHPGQVLSREQLFDEVWGMDAMGDTSTVMVHVNRLRNKLEKDPAHPVHLLTVWGSGYRWAPDK